MIAALNFAVELGMFLALLAIIYCIVQVVDVIREEKERLMWYRHERQARSDEDDAPHAGL